MFDTIHIACFPPLSSREVSAVVVVVVVVLVVVGNIVKVVVKWFHKRQACQVKEV